MPPACPHRVVSPAQALGEQGVLLEPLPNWPEAAPLCPGNPGSAAWTPALCTAEPRPAGQPGVRGRAFRQAGGGAPGASPGVYVPDGAPGRKVCGGRRTVQPWAPRPGTEQGRGQVRSPSLTVASSACCQRAAGSGRQTSCRVPGPGDKGPGSSSLLLVDLLGPEEEEEGTGTPETPPPAPGEPERRASTFCQWNVTSLRALRAGTGPAAPIGQPVHAAPCAGKGQMWGTHTGQRVHACHTGTRPGAQRGARMSPWGRPAGRRAQAQQNLPKAWRFPGGHTGARIPRDRRELV